VPAGVAGMHRHDFPVDGSGCACSGSLRFLGFAVGQIRNIACFGVCSGSRCLRVSLWFAAAMPTVSWGAPSV
jgi:hypothetical protein